MKDINEVSIQFYSYKLRLSDLQGQLKENMKSISMLNADSGETSTSNRNKADQLKSGDDYKTSFANAVGMIEQTLKK